MRSGLTAASAVVMLLACSGEDPPAMSRDPAAAGAAGTSAAGEQAGGGVAVSGGGTAGGSPAVTGGSSQNPGASGAPRGGTGGSGTTGGSETGGRPPTAGNSGSGGSAGGNGGDSGQSACEPSLTSANRAAVAAALDGLFIDKKVASIDAYWAEPYLQHNPIAESGVTAFKSIMSSVVASASFKYERLRTLADCDLAVVQGRYSGTGVIFDMFRLKDGKLIEHWDSDSNQASDAGGSLAHATTDPSEPNRALVVGFLAETLVGGMVESAAELLSPSYVEHRAASGTGPRAFIDYVTTGAISYTKVHHVIADGNLVFTLSEGKLGGSAYAFYDLFRVEAGAIVEHWDSRRKVPSSTASGLGIF